MIYETKIKKGIHWNMYTLFAQNFGLIITKKYAIFLIMLTDKKPLEPSQVLKTVSVLLTIFLSILKLRASISTVTLIAMIIIAIIIALVLHVLVRQIG